jgi:hypothetical protein
MAAETEAQTETTTTTKPEIRSGAPPSVRNRADVLAKMEAELGPDKPTVTKPEAKAQVETVADDGGNDATTAAKPDTEVTKPATPKPKAEADEDKGLERIKAAERRMRADVAKERDTVAAEKAAWQAEVKDLKQKVGAIDRLASRAAYEPAALFHALGVPADKFADISRLLYAHSSEFAKDPKNKEAADKLARQMEESDRIRKLEERQEAIEKREQELKTKTDEEKAIAVYLDDVTKEVTPADERVSQLKPARQREELRQIAEIMANEGAAISPRAVVEMLEAVLEGEAEDYGWSKPAAKAEPAKTEKKPATAPTVNGTAKPDQRAVRSQLVAKLEADDLT